MEKILFKHSGTPGLETIDTYLSLGGYDGLKAALAKSPEDVVDAVKRSGLRGRGGAGFPTGTKWGFLPKDIMPRYLCVNADEGEPGTFKDRQLMEENPHLLVEGIVIAAYAIRAERVFVYIRGEYEKSIKRVEKALAEAVAKGFIGNNVPGNGFNLEVSIYKGAGAYICGEETSLLNSIEGLRPEPRLKPPFPAVAGLYGKPTVINNVETLCCLPSIITKGAEWFTAIGSPRNAGTKIYSVSGSVKRPGNYELPLGTPLREIIFDHAGGLHEGRTVKAVIPGGASAAMLGPDKLDIAMDFDTLAAAGSMLGSAGVIVIDDATCIVGAVLTLTKFYQHESCGKCTPCREGTWWLREIIDRIEHGRGRPEDIDLLDKVSRKMAGRCFCPLGESAFVPVMSSLRICREEYEYHVREGRCMVECGVDCA